MNTAGVLNLILPKALCIILGSCSLSSIEDNSPNTGFHYAHGFMPNGRVNNFIPISSRGLTSSVASASSSQTHIAHSVFIRFNARPVRGLARTVLLLLVVNHLVGFAFVTSLLPAQQASSEAIR